MKSLEKMEGSGVLILKDLEGCTQQLKDAVGIAGLAGFNLSSLLEVWIKGYANLHPTWRHLVWALREIKLAHVADQIEHLVSGLTTDLERPDKDSSPKSDESERGEEEDEGKTCTHSF